MTEIMLFRLAQVPILSDFHAPVNGPALSQPNYWSLLPRATAACYLGPPDAGVSDARRSPRAERYSSLVTCSPFCLFTFTLQGEEEQILCATGPFGYPTVTRTRAACGTLERSNRIACVAKDAGGKAPNRNAR